MQKAKNKAYTTLIIAILALSMVLAAIPMASASPILAPTLTPSSGNVGDKVTVSGASTTPGGLIKVYWDSVKDWDGKVGFLAQGYAVGTTYSISIVIPNATAGLHYVIVKDVEANEINSTTFTVQPKIVLTPDKVLPGDTVTVTGTGFAGTANVAVLCNNTNFEGPVTNETVAGSWGGTGGSGALAKKPIIPNTVVMNVTNSTSNFDCSLGFVDDGSGLLSLNYTRGNETVSVVGSGTIDYVTGAVAITFNWTLAGTVFVNATYYIYNATIANATTSSSTSELGFFTASFKAPAVGDYNVTALDSKGNRATTILHVVPYKITLSPTKGYVGATVTVTGRGFTSSGTVDILWYMTSTPTGSYITVVDDYPIGADGTFTATFKVPTVPDPTPPGTSYAVQAIDSGGNSDSTTFMVVAPAKITLSPTSGKAGTVVSINGSWFTPGVKVSFTFDGTPLATTPSLVYTDSTGAFSTTFTVPNVAAGTYTVTATDEKGVSATATFKVTVPVIVIQTRATEYLQGDTISIYANSSESLVGIKLVITDPAGVEFWNYTIVSGDVATVNGWNVLKWNVCVVPLALPSDAPLGSWNFTAYDSTGNKIATNLFTVVERPTLATILDRLDELDVKLSGLITDAEGNLKAYIDTKLGPVTASLTEINAKLVSIENGVAEISTVVGDIEVKLDALNLSAINAKLTSIENNVVTISTSIGNVNTTLNAINAKVVSISGDVATIKTDVGTISGKVTSIDGTVATIKTDVGTIKADVSDIKGQFPITVDMTPVWIAAILALIAAIAAIYAVITIRRKIAG